MPAPVRLVLVLHNHQPVGNFDGVFEQAYEDSYKRFLDVFEPYSDLRIALHTSGPLMEWFDSNHPAYIERLKALVAAGRVEIVGGAFYEPILTMIPPEDRRGQIATYARWLEDRLDTQVRGMWTPERVWEQSLVTDIAAAGIEYTLLDDYHFKSAGLTDDALHGYFMTEDNGRVLNVFPGSERLRYLIPFAEPHESISYLGQIGERFPNAVVAFGDDGEKFGVWPETKDHVFTHGWLARFFDALCENKEWLHTVTPSQAIESVPPIGKVYIPENSYREMTEWALPSARIEVFEHLRHDLEASGEWKRAAPFFRGGFWRNFKVKYPETNEMYARMQMVSARVREADASDVAVETVQRARQALYRGQCNCGYWHGAFGGVYLPHLRNAVYSNLIAAENILDDADGRGPNDAAVPWVEADSDDYNLDARQEIRLASNRLVALFAPFSGGMMYELDVRSIEHNVLATLARRHEGYHHKVLAGPSQSDGDVASIHDRVVFKQEGLDQRVQYDAYPRKSLIDHFFEPNVSAENVASGDAAELGSFVQAPYNAKIRRAADRMQVQLTCDGVVRGAHVKLTKGVTLVAGGRSLEIAYLLEGLKPESPVHMAVEMNFAGMPSGADDRFFQVASGVELGQLGSRLDLHDIDFLGLVDRWLGLHVGVNVNRPTSFWTFPIETVSQSEGGFELVHQSVVVMPHWIVEPDANGRWAVTMRMGLDTAAAESRTQHEVAAV